MQVIQHVNMTETVKWLALSRRRNNGCKVILIVFVYVCTIITSKQIYRCNNT